MANTKITTNVIADGAITSAKLDTDISISGSITGTLATAAQPNITSVGTLTGLDVAGTPTFDGLTIQTVQGDIEIANSGAVIDMKRDSTNYIYASNAAGNLRLGSGGSFNRLNIASNGDISFYDDTGTSQALFWDASAESLAIGHTNPSSTYKIDVAGGIRSFGNAPSYTLREDDASNQTWLMASYGGNFAVRDTTVSGTSYPFQIEPATPTSTLYLDSSGNVGIGDSSPTAKLEIKQGTGNWYDGIRINRSSNTTQFGTFSNNSGATFIGAVDSAGGNNNAILFGNSTNGTTFNERMRVSSDGDIRINTTGQMGNATLTVKAYTNTNTGLMLQEYDTSNAYGLYTVTTDDSFRITRFVSGSYSDRLIIDSNGSFGINTSTLSTEASLFIGKNPTAGTQEGGQLVLQKGSGGAKAIHIDNYNNASVDYCRFMRGSDTSSEAVLGVWDITNTRFGIGTNSPAATLHVSRGVDGSESSPHFRIERSGYSAFHWLDGTAYYIGQNSNGRSLRIYSGSNETAGVQLSAGATSFGTYSDERLKENIQDIGSVTEKIKDIRCVSFNRTDIEDSKETIGFIAQDFVGKFDQVLDKTKLKDGDEEEYYSIKYTETIPVLLKAIQEQQAIIDDLKTRIEALEG